MFRDDWLKGDECWEHLFGESAQSLLDRERPPQVCDQLAHGEPGFVLVLRSRSALPSRMQKASQWIANSAKLIESKYSPTLTLVYLPHLDYCLQKVGTNPDDIAQDLQFGVG